MAKITRQKNPTYVDHYHLIPGPHSVKADGAYEYEPELSALYDKLD
jgi:hypothetical protein